MLNLVCFGTILMECTVNMTELNILISVSTLVFGGMTLLSEDNTINNIALGSFAPIKIVSVGFSLKIYFS